MKSRPQKSQDLFLDYMNDPFNGAEPSFWDGWQTVQYSSSPKNYLALDENTSSLDISINWIEEAVT